MKDFYVYAHRRAATGEIFYIGKGYGRRAWSTSGRSKHWRNTVAKEGLTVELVATGLQEWYALELEMALISLHGRRDTGHGQLVNFTDGGEGTVGAIATKESRMRKSKGVRNAWKDAVFNARFMAAAKARSLLTKKPVWLLDFGVSFDSRASAVAWLKEGGFPKASAGNLCSAIAGVYLSYCSLRWGDCESAQPRESNKGHMSRPVINLNTLKQYPSCTAAAAEMKVSHKNIWAAASGKSKSCAGVRWAFV